MAYATWGPSPTSMYDPGTSVAVSTGSTKVEPTSGWTTISRASSLPKYTVTGPGPSGMVRAVHSMTHAVPPAVGPLVGVIERIE